MNTGSHLRVYPSIVLRYPRLKPFGQSIKRYCAICDINHDIVNRGARQLIKLIATAVHHKERDNQSGPLVSINKTVIFDQSMHEGRSFSVDRPVVAGIRAANRRLDAVQIYNARPSAVVQRFIMRCDHVGKRHTVVHSLVDKALQGFLMSRRHLLDDAS